MANIENSTMKYSEQNETDPEIEYEYCIKNF